MRPYGKNAAALLREARKRKNYSQAEVSFLLGYKNGQFISNVERGKCNLPPKLLPKLCEVLEIAPEDARVAIVADITACAEYEVARAFVGLK